MGLCFGVQIFSLAMCACTLSTGNGDDDVEKKSYG